jgi:hypothetical protein
VIVRARRVQGREDDSVVKLRPVVPDELPDQLRAAPGMVVELDAMPGGYVCSASMKARLKGASGVKKRVRGKRATSKLFTKPQRGSTSSTRRGPGAGRPRGAGPDLRAQAQLDAADFGRKLCTEMWLYPDGSRILELSTKCAPSEMFQVAAEARGFLGARGIDLSGRQQTKTKTALQQFLQDSGNWLRHLDRAASVAV